MCCNPVSDKNFESIKTSMNHSHAPLLVLLTDVLGYKLEDGRLHSQVGKDSLFVFYVCFFLERATYVVLCIWHCIEYYVIYCIVYCVTYFIVLCIRVQLFKEELNISVFDYV